MRRNQYPAFLIGLALFLILFGGCRQNGDSIKTDLRDKPTSVPKASSSMNCIQAQAVVRYWLPENRNYLTEQRHLFFPSEQRMEIHSQEPQGDFLWQWSSRQFTMSPAGPSEETDAYWNPQGTLLVYSSLMYGSGILSPEIPAQEAVKIDGDWFLPRELSIPDSTMKLVLFQSRENGRIDRAHVTDPDTGKIYMAKCYNWRFHGPDNLLIPRKIDIFDISDGIASKSLKIQVDYKQVR